MTRLDANTTSMQVYDLNALEYTHIDASFSERTQAEISGEYMGAGDRDFIFHVDGKYGFTIPAMDRSVALWDIDKQVLVEKIEFGVIYPTYLMAADEKHLLLWNYTISSVQAFNYNTKKVVSTIPDMCDYPPSAYFTTWALIRKTNELITMDKTKKYFKVHNWKTGEFVGDIQTGFSNHMQAISVSQDGSTIVAAENCDTEKQSPVLIIDTISRKILCQIKMEGSYYLSAEKNVITEDGNWFGYFSEDTQHVYVWDTRKNEVATDIKHYITDDINGTVIAIYASSQQNYLLVCFQVYQQLNNTYETSYMLNAYYIATWKKVCDARITGFVTRMSSSNDGCKLMTMIQADENQLKAFHVYDFTTFSTTGKFYTIASFVIDIDTRFAYISKCGQKICIGLADYPGLTFLQKCGAQNSNRDNELAVGKGNDNETLNELQAPIPSGKFISKSLDGQNKIDNIQNLLM